jgi:gamma-glutamyltranspeptidase/glutathione hydrolase
MTRYVMTLVLALGVIVNSGRTYGQEASAAPKTEAKRAAQATYTDWKGDGKEGAVAAGGRDAVAAGISILKSGGNAADAAAATIFALSVTDSRSFCFGGEVPILFYDAAREVVTVIDGQGAAPRLATLDHFKTSAGIPAKGIEPAAIPAALDACLTLLDRFGIMTFTQVIAPTKELLKHRPRPEPWHANLLRTLLLLESAEAEAGDRSLATVAPKADRSRGLRLVADAFYRGPIARRIDAWAREHGSLLRYADLATHVTRLEEPVSINYRGHTIYKCGVWTQGPALLEALQILAGFNLRAMGHNRPDAIHSIAEALKLALADRDTYYADPHFADVPLAGLLSPEYATLRRDLIDTKHASLERRPGDPRSKKAVLDPAADPARRHVPPPLADAHDTTTCLVADRFGNVVAATPSGWSGVVAGDTGVWLGSRLQSFNTWEDHPNVIVPGKRPRITLSPTLVLKNRRPVLAVSVAGGDNQDQMTLQLVLNHIDFGLEPAESVTAPRFMSDHFINSFRQSPPKLGRLRMNPELGNEILGELKGRGHILSVNTGSLSAAPCVISFDAATGSLRAAGDPRAGRHALAY